MALLDRFRSLPVAKHPDPDVRLAHVEGLAIDARDELASFAREDESPRIRRAAVGKLMDPAMLAVVAREDADAGVRAHAVSMLRDIALEAFEETSEADSLAAVDALSDPKALAQIAKTSTRAAVAERALGRIDDARNRGSVARHAVLEPIRMAAIASLSDRDEIVAVAMNSAFKDTAMAAVDRLTEPGDLERIAERSNNKSAAKRARGILRQAQEQTDADAHAVDVLDESSLESDADANPQGDGSRTDSVVAVDAADQQPAVEQSASDAAADASAAAATPESEVQAVPPSEEAPAAAATTEASRKQFERRRERLVELVAELEAALADEDLRSARRRRMLVQREWRNLTSSGGVGDDTLAERYEAADSRLTVRDHEAREEERRARHEALVRMQQMLENLEALAQRDDLAVKAVERALRDARNTLGHIPPLPSKQEYEEVMRRLKAVQAVLTPKLQALREVEGWQRWANVGIQEQLCEKMEALISESNPEQIVHRIRDLQQQWRQAADVPRAQSDVLWQRFKKAHDEVWARCEAFFAAEAQTRAENLQKKLALCERVEAIADSTAWIQTAEAIKVMQAEWKTIGPVSRGQEKAVWERFRAACDRFFSRRHDDLAKRKATWSENFTRKDALCARVEALADSTDWEAAAAEIKRLQAEWKTIGAVKKSRSDMIWLRFRSACDKFFARYAQRHEIARGERVAAREAICAEMESLAPAAEPDGTPAAEPQPAAADLFARVRSLRGRWQQELAARGVEPARAVELDKRFAAAFERVRAARHDAFSGTDLDPDVNRQRMEALVDRVEKLASSLRGPASRDDAALSPTTRLAAMLKEALASNTIGGKVDEGSRLRAAQEDVRQAQASWSRIGPVPDAIARPLIDRFQRACRAVAAAVQPAAGGSPSHAAAGSPRPGSGRHGGPGRSSEPAR
jgi:hypothetical protein